MTYGAVQPGGERQVRAARSGKRAGKATARRAVEAKDQGRLREIRGKLADVPGSVDEFLRIKHAENEAGKCEWRKILSGQGASPGDVGGKIMTRIASGRSKAAKRRPKAKTAENTEAITRPMSHEELVRSICGKYAYVPYSSDDYLRDKAREAELED